MLRLKARPLSSRPLVSVVVPCYNYGRYLPDAVGSALDQPGIDVEVIIVDDASTDGSADVAERLAAADGRVTLVRHERNQGHIATYNDGLARVSGELVVLLSADDLLAPGALTRAAALFEARPEVGLVYGYAQEFHSSPSPRRPRGGPTASGRTSWLRWRGQEWMGLSCLRGRNFILSPEAVVRSAVLRTVGYYNPSMPHAGDLEYWIRTAAAWDVARVNGPVQAYYRTHADNMHRTTYNTMAIDLRHRLSAFRSIQTLELLPMARQKRLISRAERAICREALLLTRRLLDGGGSFHDAESLVAVATEADPGAPRSLSGRGVERRMRRSRKGLPPTFSQKATEFLRKEVDRVRWTLWRKLGVS